MTSVVLLSGVVPGTTGAVSAAPAGPSGTGQDSPPVWFPLRRGVTGADVKVGCTYLSRGTQGGYDCAGHHSYWALDLMAATGTSIYSAGAGYATNVTGQAPYSGYGNVVVVDHGNNTQSLYAHMSVVQVSTKGVWVDQNTVIGKVGATGDASTPHLHFEITSSGRFSAGSRDPGPLQACHGAQLVSYPKAWGLSTWQGIAWGTQSAYSDGTGCTQIAPQIAPQNAPQIAPQNAGASTVLVADPGLRRPLGLLGLGGTKVTYSVHLQAMAGASAVVGATVTITAPGKQPCSRVTDATGTAVCVAIYALLRGPPRPSTFDVTFAGDSSRLPSKAIGSIP